MENAVSGSLVASWGKKNIVLLDECFLMAIYGAQDGMCALYSHNIELLGMRTNVYADCIVNLESNTYIIYCSCFVLIADCCLHIQEAYGAWAVVFARWLSNIGLNCMHTTLTL